MFVCLFVCLFFFGGGCLFFFVFFLNLLLIEPHYSSFTVLPLLQYGLCYPQAASGGQRRGHLHPALELHWLPVHHHHCGLQWGTLFIRVRDFISCNSQEKSGKTIQISLPNFLPPSHSLDTRKIWEVCHPSVITW